MIEYHQLTKRCQELVDSVKRALNNSNGTSPEIFLIQIPAGTEKDQLVAHLAYVMKEHKQRMAYLSATDESVIDTYRTLTK